MRRAGKTTIPYTLSLFCAVSGLILLLAAATATVAWVDIRSARPAQIEITLRQAVDAPVEHIEAFFDPLKNQLRASRHWVEAGVIPATAPVKWPAVLLPTLANLPPVVSVSLTTEDGAYWSASRDGGRWLGSFADADTDAVASAWNASGEAYGDVPELMPEAPPQQSEWYREARRMAEDKAGAIYCSEIPVDGRRPVTLATPVTFQGGQRGALAFQVDIQALRATLARARAGETRLWLDPGGTLYRKMQDSPTLALLEERAVPASANPALEVLFSSGLGAGDRLWYRSSAYPLGENRVWWVVAAVDEANLPIPPLPVVRYIVLNLAAGLIAAVFLAIIFGRQMTRPLQQVAARARNIQALDEHYLPWPQSRITEINTLTHALEDIYESAVEHLDYHDAPLVAWAEDDSVPDDDSIVVDAVRHVMNIPRGNGHGAPAEPREAPINVAGDLTPAQPATPPAAQLQVLHGARREVRRLQGQLSGASEELRTTSARYEEGQARMRRQRTCLRALHKQLQTDGGVGLAVLETVRDVLATGAATLWIAGEQRTRFRLRIWTGSPPETSVTLDSSHRLRGLLDEESCVAVYDCRNDDRLRDLTEHPYLRDHADSLLLAPIKMAGQLLGFLLAVHQGTPRRWKSDEELFITSVAAQCAGPLWQQLRRQARAIAAAHVKNGNGQPAQSGTNGARNGHGAHQDHGALPPQPANGRGRAVELEWETDLAGCIKGIRGEVEAIYGRTADQLLGQPITFLSDGQQGSADLDRLSHLIAGRRCTGYRTWHLCADGTAVELYIEGEVLRDANDGVMGAHGTVRRVPAAVEA